MIGKLLRRAAYVGMCVLTLGGAAQAQNAPNQITAVLQAEVKILDPHFTAVYITRNFAYMVYDTLFAMNAAGEIRPQMVDTWTVSDDRLTWTFTLRDGLKFHDGTPVTAADCVASIRRWGPRDGLGRQLIAATESLEAIDARTFRLTLSRPFGLVLDALGKPSSFVPAIMPERLARTPGSEQVTEVVGSGPFIFRRDLWVPGDRVVLDRNPAYVPRNEPADFLAGGKVVHVERVVLKTIADSATAVSALQAGEVDFIELPALDLVPLLQHDENVRVVPLTGPNMWAAYMRLNHASGPFTDPEVRRVLWMAIDQSATPAAMGATGDLALAYCPSFWMCGTPYENDAGAEISRNPSIAAARAALKRTRYNGEPVVILQATDLDAARAGGDVVAHTLREVGFNVDLQTTDWGTVIARRARREGWSMFSVPVQGFDIANPLTHFYVVNNCQDYLGWTCDERMTPLFTQFAQANSQDERRRIAADIQRVAYENTPAVMLGQYSQPLAYRRDLRGVIESGIPVFWNIRRQ